MCCVLVLVILSSDIGVILYDALVNVAAHLRVTCAALLILLVIHHLGLFLLLSVQQISKVSLFR